MKLALGFAATGLCLALGAWSGQAHAALSDCGNIDVEADAECKVEVEGGCTAHCDPPEMRLACIAELDASCEGECKVEAEVSCTGSCNVDCAADCKVDPGSFECSAECEANA